MSDLLLVYASKHGHTAKIARRIAEVLVADGAGAVVHDIGAARDVDPEPFAGVIAGGSIHAGHHQPELVDWAARRSVTLNAKPSAFFSVSLSAAEDTDESREASRTYHDDFLAATGWTPGRWVGFAGALQYREYDLATRVLMRLLMRKGGHPTDASVDYDYTDWSAVEAFAHECARDLGRAGPAT
jgi:menaquinone-dependent protoporphyrinogen oxidase